MNALPATVFVIDDAVYHAMMERLGTLTSRERQVLERVVRGQLNKQIAADLGTVEKTIKVHRAHVMRKMGVRSLPDLVRVALAVGIITELIPCGIPHPNPLPRRSSIQAQPAGHDQGRHPFS